ncbi:SIMPL domain-containing protein [Fusibacter ferrireducens]|uniref:SIMPL domain-containing protein n=1 Tax=Fusibacter ferrireducens TaxID=2785058 RepID=A0ABR9ZWJ4_9FIRM|nr:SIMPL domain-containing protein [Fusibacter ferrireducens]MBF4694843.1 SIMPL domain-containing protein [Fusibacter ferrireducens]
MKSKIITMIALVMVAVLAIGAVNSAPVSVADASADTNQRVVNVTGEGKIVVAPDLAYINLGVQTKNEDAQKAQQENTVKMNAVVEAIKKAGIKAENIKTTGYNIYQNYDYTPNSEVKNEYYQVNNTVNLKITDIESVGKIIDVATAAGANSVNNIQFTVADDSKYYAEALKLAMGNANSKATAIMSTFNKKPGLPVSVSEASYGGSTIYKTANVRLEMDSAMGSTPIESGEITIEATVTVGYDY